VVVGSLKRRTKEWAKSSNWACLGILTKQNTNVNIIFLLFLFRVVLRCRTRWVCDPSPFRCRSFGWGWAPVHRVIPMGRRVILRIKPPLLRSRWGRLSYRGCKLVESCWIRVAGLGLVRSPCWGTDRWRPCWAQTKTKPSRRRNVRYRTRMKVNSGLQNVSHDGKWE